MATIGCGTGNNSFKLSKIFGEEGMAVAIDPIKERTYKAYGSLSTNLEFAEGDASDCWKFGIDFDLLADQEREEAFTGILKCMKPNALFAFCTAASGNHNMAC